MVVEFFSVCGNGCQVLRLSRIGGHIEQLFSILAHIIYAVLKLFGAEHPASQSKALASMGECSSWQRPFADPS